MKREKLSSDEIARQLQTLPEWKLDEGCLFRKLTFPDFNQAFAFMTKVALIAESINHHPDWQNVYNTVSIHLSTHDAGGITALDFEMASRISQAAGKTP